MTGREPMQLGRYKLLALLATGGMAEIHLAQQTGIRGFERLVVVKRILPHLARDEGFLEMFFDEARIAAQLSHPNIVQIHDLGQEGDDYYIAMEYLEGESLSHLEREARKKQKTLPQNLAAGIIAQTCDGLDYAHGFTGPGGEPLHIVHRDVSPQNIIVLYTGGVKLVDFGVAKAASQMHETRAGSMKGKLAYMAPEQIMGKAVDRRADVFSLGVVLWELLTRKRLFKRDNDGATVQAILNEEVPSIRGIRFGIPEELESIVLRALEKSPGDRFESAGQMGQALREFLRRTGAAASTREISAFVHGVFAERLMTKKRRLEKIRASDGEISSISQLKMDQSDSMPSRSQIEDLPTPTDGALQGRPARKEPPPPPPVDKTPWPGDEAPAEEKPPAGAPAPRGGIPNVFWVGLSGFMFCLGLVIVWLALKGTSSGGAQPRPDPGPGATAAGRPAADAGRRAGADAATGHAGTAPSPDPVPASCFLAVSSTPSGCGIKLNGVLLSRTTPTENMTVVPDTEHRVAVICPGHLEDVKAFTGKPGESIRLAFSPRPLEADTRPQYGYLRLATEPWTEIYLGKRKLGVTPILKLKLRAGRHRLTAVNQAKGINKKIPVVIRPGQITKLVKTFD